MKKSNVAIIAGVLIIALLVSYEGGWIPFLHSGPDDGPTVSALHVDGAKIVDASGQQITLVGLNYGDHPMNTPAMTGDPANDASKIKAMGFNAVRLVKEWGALENSANPSVISYNQSSLTSLSEQVDALTSQGLYVIVKLTADGDNSYDYNNLQNFLGSSQYCNSMNDYVSKMGDSFFMTSSSVKTSGSYHLTQLWLKISGMTANNPLVVGYDFLNEPTTCPNSPQPPSTIRAAWHARIGELLNTLRKAGDNRIAYVEEAPFFAYYSGGFTPYSDPLSNTIGSIHWYRNEYPVRSKSWQACSGNMTTLIGYYGNVTGSSGSLCSNAPIWAYQAQQKFPKQAFDIGEFGAIWGNSPGDIDDQWINNSLLLFRNQHLTGWFYWGSNSTGTWIPDITGNFTIALSQTLLMLNSPSGSSSTTNITLSVTTSHPFTTTATITFASNDTFTNSTSGPLIQFDPQSARPASPGSSLDVTVSVTVGSSIQAGTYRFTIYGSTQSGLTNSTVLIVTVT